MALFVFFILVIINSFLCLLGEKAVLEIKPSTVTGGKNVGFYKVQDTLNLTCTLKVETEVRGAILEWVSPNKTSKSSVSTIFYPEKNLVMLIIENLQENDSGDYKCTAHHNSIPLFKSVTVSISVKNKKKDCPDARFQCFAGLCISKRYTCDGISDCPNGEDESPLLCGPGNPCENKLLCPDNRCIPFHWCCEYHKEPNCTTKVKLSCCNQGEKLTLDNDLAHQYEQQMYSNMGFLQTTVYTVIGCVMAFMFIMIIIIAIGRVHVRRTILSRCSTGRNLPLGRGGNVHGNHFNGFSFYDLDLYFNRSGLNGRDLAVNPLLVTYSINNGVQFVGRPIDPPPYCEVVTSPPKEGPPPLYVSQENLTVQHTVKVDNLNSENEDEYPDILIDSQESESDALLEQNPQCVSVINSIITDSKIPGGTPALNEVPCVERIDGAEMCLDDGQDSTCKSFLNSVVNSNSSHGESAVSKCLSLSNKNCSLEKKEILNGFDSVVMENSETIKLQNGESSSYISSGMSDVSKESGEKRGTPLDKCKRKAKNYAVNQVKNV